jgi:hypothetical protein
MADCSFFFRLTTRGKCHPWPFPANGGQRESCRRNPQKTRVWAGRQSPHPASAGFFHGLLACVLGLLAVAESQTLACDLHAAALLPSELRSAVLAAGRRVADAETPNDLLEAHLQLDRIAERQHQAGRTWLVADDFFADVAFEPYSSGSPQPGLLHPLDRLLDEMRRQLAAASGDIAHCQALLASGDTAFERGWTGAADEAWSLAAMLAGKIPSADLAQKAMLRQATLAKQKQADSHLESPRDEGRLPPGSAGFSKRRLRWQQKRAVQSDTAEPLMMSLTSTAVDDDAELVFWHESGSVHARRCSDGKAPWGERSSSPFSDRLFPPIGDATTRAPAWAPCVDNDRLLSVLSITMSPSATPDGTVIHQLICLDITSAAEGRLMWSLRLPVSDKGRAGRPVTGRGLLEERLAFVCLQDERTELCCVRLADGKLLWRRPLGLPGDNQVMLDSPVLRTLEDMIIVASAAHGVWAVTVTGDLAWVRPPGVSADFIAAGDSPANSGVAAVVASGRVVIRDSSACQAFAYDIRTGRMDWRFPSQSAIDLAGNSGQSLIVAQDRALVSISTADGSLQATCEIPGQLMGAPLVVDRQVVLPVLTSASPELQILVLSPDTLQSISEPLSLGADSSEGLAVAANADCLLVSDGPSITAYEHAAVD